MKYFGKIDQRKQPRALTRCGCKARQEVQKSENGGTHSVTSLMLFYIYHNVQLLTTQSVTYAIDS
uniref:Uncharacterized protein n=1 Tax=Arundo donax TaxID=35708 RepID=A0A0A9CVL5_ARUDO